MCGLTAIWSKKGTPVGQQVFEQYTKQKHRGKEGYGYLSISKDWVLQGEYRSLGEDKIKQHLMKQQARVCVLNRVC